MSRTLEQEERKYQDAYPDPQEDTLSNRLSAAHDKVCIIGPLTEIFDDSQLPDNVRNTKNLPPNFLFSCRL